jgi:hypothetical protein
MHLFVTTFLEHALKTTARSNVMGSVKNCVNKLDVVVLSVEIRANVLCSIMYI